MIKSLVILGGGTAGWMTAAAFSQMFRHDTLNILLIESDEIGTIGVGESTIPAIRDFNRLLGIDEQEFIRETRATPKLAIKFSDWGHIGQDYFHPFGQAGHDINAVDFHHHWLSLRHEADIAEFSRFSISAEAAEQGRFSIPSQSNNFWSSTFSYAFHFDAGLYAKYLRKYAEARGVKRVEGKYLSADRNRVTGDIERLNLVSGQQIEADFFIDATGFRALLLNGVLQSPYESWSEWLKCDSAIAIPCATGKPFKAFTHATAHSAGWRWRIPLQHRVGNGSVYSSEYMSKENALDNLLANLEAEPLAEPRYLSFMPGMRQAQWENNCVGIGLSAGFLEPLESTSIYLIQYGIQKLIEYFPVSKDFSLAQKEFNLQLAKEFVRIRDFIIMHYAENQRDDSQFWIDCRNMHLPEGLAYRQAMFRGAGLVDPTQYGLYASVCLGQNVMPEFFDARVSAIPTQQRKKILQGIKHDQEAFILQFPLLVDWLRSSGAIINE
ncbi:MAG: tryptophan 7-halogenase [Gammaproteobacteria bacterium]|nr:MAG: tryptophan 7-halogenase [Gammaproteobacteria bacterium]